MSNYWPKQRASRHLITTALTSASSPVKASAQTYQLRVVGSTAVSLSVTDSSATQLSSTLCPNIAANVVGEYFAISPGQWYFAYGTASVSEMT